MEAKVPAGSRAELVLTAPDGAENRQTIFTFKGDGIALGMHNTEESIRSFARSCFNYALDLGEDLWFGTKDTISKTYDHRFKDILRKFMQTSTRTALKRLVSSISTR